MSTELHHQLDQLVGTWRTRGRIVDGSTDSDTWAGYDVYEWFPGGRHLVHRVDVEMGGQRNEGLEILTPRGAGSSTCDQTSYNSDGSVEHATGSFDAQGRYHNDLPDARATLTLVSADRMRATWERRDPRGGWADWMEVEFTRVAGPHIEVRSKDDHTR